MKKENNKTCNIIPAEYFTGEDWLRAGRREFLLLNVIYYLQNFGGKENGVSKEDISEFLEALRKANMEMYLSIIKPKIPLEVTLKELLSDGLIVKMAEGKYVVNKEKIKSEKDLIYWRSVRKIFDNVAKEIGSK